MAEDQRYAIKILVIKKKKRNEVVREIQTTFGDRSMSKARIYVWFNRFSNGWDKAGDLKKSGRKVTSTGKKTS